MEVIGVALSGEEAIDKINDLHPDLVFMDIEMPGMSGFDVLHRLSPVTFNIIFVTAYDQYAIQAFRYAKRSAGSEAIIPSPRMTAGWTS